jgi:hypothetical protein
MQLQIFYRHTAAHEKLILQTFQKKPFLESRMKRMKAVTGLDFATASRHSFIITDVPFGRYPKTYTSRLHNTGLHSLKQKTDMPREEASQVKSLLVLASTVIIGPSPAELMPIFYSLGLQRSCNHSAAKIEPLNQS